MTLILKVLSIVCLSLALVVFCGVRKLREQFHFQVLSNLCFNLVVADILFLSGVVNATYIPELCLAIAAFLHYLYLCAFGWMLVEGLYIFCSVTTV